MDLARLIRRRVQEALEAASDSSETTTGGANIAAAANIGRSGRSTAVYSDDDVTIVQRDGHTEVFHHGADRAGDAGGADGPDRGKAGGGRGGTAD